MQLNYNFLVGSVISSFLFCLVSFLPWFQPLYNRPHPKYWDASSFIEKLPWPGHGKSLLINYKNFKAKVLQVASMAWIINKDWCEWARVWESFLLCNAYWVRDLMAKNVCESSLFLGMCRRVFVREYDMLFSLFVWINAIINGLNKNLIVKYLMFLRDFKAFIDFHILKPWIDSMMRSNGLGSCNNVWGSYWLLK